MRTAAVLTLLVASTSAYAGAGGTMILTAEQVDTSSSGFEKAAKKAAITELKGSNDSWQLFFIAFLKKAAGAPQLNIVFYDKAEKAHEPVNAFPITTQSNAKVLASSVQFGTDQGFKAGHKYDVLITRLVGGHEDVYARSVLTLK